MTPLRRLCPLAGLTACVLLALGFSGESRSISDSSYRRHSYSGGTKVGYPGELNEFDVLGVDRIQLKMTVIDVRTGNWTMFAPESFESRAMSDKLRRESSDQGQVEKLKRLAYEAVATDLTKIYAN